MKSSFRVLAVRGRAVTTSALFVASLGAVASCSHKLDGPTPSVTGVLPAAVCQVQLNTTVQLSGAGLSPLVTGALATSELELPALSLVEVKDIDGNAKSAAAISIPDDPKNPTASHTRWMGQMAMSFDVYPELNLPTGLYDVDVANSNGKTGTFPASLLAVPPPTVSKIVHDIACGDKANVVELDGDFFIQSGTDKPTVTFGETMLPAASLEDCRDLPGSAGLKACKKLTVQLDAKTLAVGTYDVNVSNPKPVGCGSTEKIHLTIVPAPMALSAVADLGCSADGDTMVAVKGTGFLTIDEAVPAVTIGSLTLIPTASDCTVVAGPSETVQSCNTLTVTVPKGTATGKLAVAVTNPAPADCTSMEMTTYTIVPEPMVTAIVPELGCSAEGDVMLSIKGSGFLSVEAAVPQVAMGTLMLIPTLSDCTAIDGPMEHVQTCNTLVVTVPKGTSPGSLPVIVTNPPPAACVSTSNLNYAVVPPPAVASIVADAVCVADSAVDVTVTGTGFLTVGAAAPTVDVGGQILAAVPSNCTALAGLANTTAQECTTLKLTIPKGAAASSLTLAVKNPAPAGCTSTPRIPFVIFDRPVIASVQPAATCGQSAAVPLTLTGTGFVTVAGTAPAVKVGTHSFAATASGCTAVPGLAEATQLCTTLSISVPANTFTVGQYPVLVTNPGPVGCASVGTSVYEVTSPPVLTSVAPTTVCAGAAQITLTGTSFGVNATVTLGTTAATGVAVTNNGTTASANFAAGLPVGGPYDVTIQNAASCSSTKPAVVTVVAGPQIYFVDPPVVYNGIVTQATVYGSGFTGAVQSVSIRPTTGGTAQSLPFTIDPNHPHQVQLKIPVNQAPGVYDVELHDTTACPAVLSSVLTVTGQKTLALAVPAMTPAFGWAQANTATTISADPAGSGFAPVPRVYLNPTTPDGTTPAASVGAVTFVDRNTLSALVSGLPVGKYDVIVVNPDGKVGVATAGFEVTAAAPPTIASLSPGSVVNQTAQKVTILGHDFRTPAVTLRCLDAQGAFLATSPTAMVSASTATSINVTFDASQAGVACVVRVTDGDNMTYGEFSAVVVTNPAQNLYAATNGPDLTTARRAPVALAGNASSTARYLHVVAGDNGSGTAMDTVETAALNLQGVPSAFAVQRNKLGTARTLAGGVSIGRFLYIVGGSNGSAPLTSIERAPILDPSDRPSVSDLSVDIDPTTGLGAGTWYYRVAAVMGATDAFNPNGENLPSDPFPVRLPAVGTKAFQITLTWNAVAGAAKYRVYRSPTSGATVGTEQLLAEVTGATSYKDLGAAPTSTQAPLAVGSVGLWQTLAASLKVAREGVGVAWGPDPSTAGRAYLYAVGGRQNGTTALASYEYLGLTLNADGSQTPDAAVTAPATNPLATARWQLGASRAASDLSSAIAAGTTYIYALGGLAANGTTVVSDADAAAIQAGGALGTWTALRKTARAGYFDIVAGNFVIAFGGANAGPDAGVVSGQICTTGMGGCAGPPNVVNFNAGQSMNVARYLMGGALSGANIYITGGVTAAGTPPTLTKSTEYRFW